MAINKSLPSFKLETLVGNLYSGILVEDVEQKVVLTNQKYCQLFSLLESPEDLIGEKINSVVGQLFKDAQHYFERIQEIVQNQEAVYQESIELVDGRVMERDYIPIIEEGEQIYHFWQYRDVTKYKQTERLLMSSKEEVEKLNKSLAEKVEDVVKKSRETDHIAMQQSRLAAMGEMIGNIGHQWRQPLNILSLYIQDVRDAYRFNELNDNYLDNLVQKCFLQIRHMSRTINDFRNFFHPHKEAVPFSPSEQIKTAISILSSTLEESKITVSFQNGNKKVVNGFPNEFSQVVINLLINCRDVYATKMLDEKTIDITISDDSKNVIVKISDKAGGIPDEIISKIFEPYFTTKLNGTGVGLYMSKMIMEHMQGTIKAENIDRGATFTLTIPILK